MKAGGQQSTTGGWGARWVEDSRLGSALRWVRRECFSRIDRYIIRKFLGTYFFSLILIIAIAVVFDFSENSEKLIVNHAPTMGLIHYYMDFVPFYCNMFSALFVFIAVILFTSKMASNSEIIAMMSCGMSVHRLLRPYIISAAIIAALSIYLGTQVIPEGSVRRLDFEVRYKERKKPMVKERMQLQVEPGVIAYIDYFDGNLKGGYRFSLDKFENKSLVSHLTAQRIQYDTLADERFHWKLYDVKVRALQGLKEEITTTYFVDTVITMEPSDFITYKYHQQTLTNAQLTEYVTKQKNRGAGNVAIYEVEYHKRWADPFAAFVLAAIGFFLSFRKRKGGMGAALGLGIALSAVYILFQSVTSTLATNSGWPPILAAWLPNIIYTFIAFYIYRKTRM